MKAWISVIELSFKHTKFGVLEGKHTSSGLYANLTLTSLYKNSSVIW